MGKIRILAEHVVNQIAAGEVVERAASVLKELIENSLDAGATRIQVIAKAQGRELIQVIDDGNGMSREDLQLAFERHATSKLERPEDLFAIRTFGFRGEALPSIASVSFVEVRSGAKGAAGGTLMRLEGGDVRHLEPVAATSGTSISVHSLFHNTPARARFLKSPATELAHLVRIFKQYALAWPEITWSLSHDDVTEYTLPATTAEVRLEELFGSGFAGKVLPVDLLNNGVTVTGFLGKPELNKKSRGDQYLYLNRRPIQSTLLHSAVKAALKDQMEQGEWPFYVIFLEMDPTRVDVNVHPAKLEVKFADEKLVHSAVFRAIRAALPATYEDVRAGFGHPLSAPEGGAFAPVPSHHGFAAQAPAELSLPLSSIPEPPPDADTVEAAAPRSVEGMLYRPAIFQVHNKYLISQIQSGLAVIDQHAAHERILYEKAQRHFQERMFNSQQLLFPMLLELEADEDAVFQEIRPDLESLGFQIRDFGVRTYSVEAVPAGIKRASEVKMISEVIEEYQEFRRENFTPRDAVAASFACRAAIKTGDPLTSEEMSVLVDELFATKFPLACPHGRPTVIHIKLNELDRRFKRLE